MNSKVAYFAGNTKFHDNVGPSMFSGPLVSSGLTLEAAMAIAWRIRKWTCAVSGDIRFTGGDTYTFSFSQPFEFSKPGGIIVADNESDFVKFVYDNRFNYGIQPTHFYILGNTGISFQATGLYYVTGIPGTLYVNSDLSSDPTMNYLGDLFDIGMGFFASTAINIGDSGGTGVTTTGTTLGPLYWPPGSNPLATVDPVIAPAFTIPLMSFAAKTFLSSWVSTVDFRWTALEFWPYADSSGNPVYDKTTGAQLRDPFG